MDITSDSDLFDEEPPTELNRGLAVGYGGESPDPLPTALGDYRIVREIGRGGMGVVYLAEEVTLARQVALKVLPAHLTLQEHMVERFRIEASSAARLKHPGIVRVYHVGVDAGHHYFAMELLEGGSLQDVIEELRREGLEKLDGARFGRSVARQTKHVPELPEPAESGSAVWQRPYVETVCRLVAQIAEALQHAHDAGVVHRDVKPANIIVRQDGTAVLTDFGLARQDGTPHLTRTGAFVGTLHYMSPEQARAGSKHVDNRSDVFSLGVTLYELLTLERPFEGKTPAEVLERFYRHEPVNPRKINRRLPIDLATITLKALEKDPSRRYQTAGALAADLASFLRFESISARPASFASRVVKLGRRHRAATTTVILALLAGLAVAAWWWSQEVRFRVESKTDGATVFLDGNPLGTTNEDLYVEPGPHTVRVAKPPGLFSLEQRVTFERGERQVNRIELTSLESFQDDLLEGGGTVRAWIAQGLPEPFREGIEQGLRERDVRLVKHLARSEFEQASVVMEEIDRLDCIDEERAATRRAAELLESAREVESRARQLYDEAMTRLEEGAESGEVLTRILALRRLRFQDWEFGRAAADAEELTQELARRTAERTSNHLEAMELEDASRSLALLEDVDPAHPQLDSLGSRLEKALTRDRIDRLRTEADRHRDPKTADPVRLEEIVGELRGLSVGAEVLEDLDLLLVAARFEQWLESNPVESNAIEAIVSGSTDGLASAAKRLESAIDVASPGLDEPPLPRYLELETALARALEVVEQSRVIAREPDPEKARRELDALRRLALPQGMGSAVDALLSSVEERIGARERCEDLLDECAREVGWLRLSEARSLLKEANEVVTELVEEDAAELSTRVSRERTAVEEARRSEAELAELLRPFSLFLFPPRPLESAEADRSRQTLLGRLERHRRRISAAIDLRPPDDHAATLLLERARLALHLNDWTAAEADAVRASVLAPGAEAHLLAGRALTMRARAEKAPTLARRAIEHFDRALSRPDLAPVARCWRGVARAEFEVSDAGSGEWNGIVEDLRAGLEARATEAPEIHQTIAEVLGADLESLAPAERAERREAVVQHANQALDLLDATAEDLGEMDEVAVFEETVRRMRRDVLLLRGRAYADGKKWKAAVSTFEEATRVDEAHAESWMRLANARTGIPADESYYLALEDLKRVETLAIGSETLTAAVIALRREIHRWLRGSR